MSISTTLLLSLKIILISSGAISIALAIKFSVPSIIAFTCYDLPLVCNSLLSWLKPPYLYLIINCIIITIAASTRFNHHYHHNQSKDPDSYQLQEPLVSARTPSPESDVVAEAEVVLAQREPELDMNVVEAPVPLPPVVEVYATEAEDDDEEEGGKESTDDVELNDVMENGVHTDDVAKDDWMVPESSFTAPQKIVSPKALLDFVLPVNVKEKPLLSSRFGHRKPMKTSPEGGRALRVARPKRQETLESTWKMITEGRHVPLTRHLKKSDTLENHSRENSLDQAPKSETFKDRTNYAGPTLQPTSWSPIPGKIKKDPSLGHDELNRRVEAFIKKFNEEMRMQRQESLNQYMEMINRGAY